MQGCGSGFDPISVDNQYPSLGSGGRNSDPDSRSKKLELDLKIKNRELRNLDPDPSSKKIRIRIRRTTNILKLDPTAILFSKLSAGGLKYCRN